MRNSRLCSLIHSWKWENWLKVFRKRCSQSMMPFMEKVLLILVSCFRHFFGEKYLSADLQFISD